MVAAKESLRETNRRIGFERSNDVPESPTAVQVRLGHCGEGGRSSTLAEAFGLRCNEDHRKQGLGTAQ